MKFGSPPPPGTRMNNFNLKAKITAELLNLNTGSKALG